MRLNFSLTELQRAITPEYLRVSRMLAFALAMGAVMFFAVILVLYNMTPPDNDADETVVQMLSIVNLVFALSVYAASSILSKKLLSAESLDQSATNPIQAFLMRLRTVMIIRTAMFEGVAFFGLVILLLSATSGLLHVKPLYWLNGIYAAILVAMIALTFPSKERIEHEYQNLSQG